jgi:hypothetical protein
MESNYQVTPEMLGLSWSRLFRLALARSILYLLGALLFSFLWHRRWVGPLGVGMSGAVFDFLITFLVRFYVPSNLRITDSSIEEVDGPIVRKGTIITVKEYSDGKCPGIEIVGPGQPIGFPSTASSFPRLCHSTKMLSAS